MEIQSPFDEMDLDADNLIEVTVATEQDSAMQGRKKKSKHGYVVNTIGESRRENSKTIPVTGSDKVISSFKNLNKYSKLPPKNHLYLNAKGRD